MSKQFEFYWVNPVTYSICFHEHNKCNEDMNFGLRLFEINQQSRKGRFSDIAAVGR